MIRLKIWKAIVDKIQTFACYINIGISIYPYIWLHAISKERSQFELQFYRL